MIYCDYDLCCYLENGVCHRTKLYNISKCPTINPKYTQIEPVQEIWFCYRKECKYYKKLKNVSIVYKGRGYCELENITRHYEKGCVSFDKM